MNYSFTASTSSVGSDSSPIGLLTKKRNTENTTLFAQVQKQSSAVLWTLKVI